MSGNTERLVKRTLCGGSVHQTANSMSWQTRKRVDLQLNATHQRLQLVVGVVEVV